MRLAQLAISRRLFFLPCQSSYRMNREIISKERHRITMDIKKVIMILFNLDQNSGKKMGTSLSPELPVGTTQQPVY